VLGEHGREFGHELLGSGCPVARRLERVVGLRDGGLAFDLPGTEVTRARLAQLYEQHEHELAGATPPAETGPVAAPAVTMVCR